MRQRIRPDGAHHQFGNALVNLRPSHLENRRLGTRRGRVPLRGQHAQVGDLQSPQVDFHLRDLRGEQRILDQRPPLPALARRDALEPREFAFGDADAGNVRALVPEQKLGVGPAAVLLADAVFHRHAHVLEPDLVDLMAAVEQHDGPHRDAGTLHVDQQKCDAGLLLRMGVGAHQAENPIRILTERVPGLLAVDDVVVPVAHGARFQRRQIRTGAGFRIPLAPPLLSRADLRQESPLLRGGAEGHDDRRHHLGAEGNQARTAGQRRFFLEDVLLHRVPARAAELHGPAHAAPAALMQAALPQQVLLPAELVAVRAPCR